MAAIKKNTREHLIAIAGELFAKDGFDGVSTRTIAEGAEVKLSAIHYHFGKKENLYMEALTMAVEHDSCANFSVVINENPALLETAEGQAEIIRNTVFRTFHDRFKKDNPPWMTQLLLREILKPSAIFKDFYNTVFKPDVEAAKGLYLKAKPDAQPQQPVAWLDILHSQVFFYVMAEETLEIIRGPESMNTMMYRNTARVVARAMILELELPLPMDLQ